ncbi:MAG: glucosaminidase domain-containing protein [Sulfurimonas sp.]|nr:glucosaminidase domain-containing protein [Sulfurimonas sp.]
MMFKTPFLILLLLLTSLTSLHSSQFSFRKYSHVESFYSDISLNTIEIGLRYKLPPAAIMAIAGLESGYGSGYVAQITGNILSLGAFKGDRELPRLYLPYSKSSKMVIFDAKEIKKHSRDDLSWKKRPKSLKRDYRPEPHAGSTKNLELLLYDKKLKDEACKACLNDFATRWIKTSSNVKVFRDARAWLDKEISSKGMEVLFNKETNKKFIDMIGGQPHSFNYRKTWPKKAKLIMNRVGLVKLSTDMYVKKMSFKKAWINK